MASLRRKVVVAVFATVLVLLVWMPPPLRGQLPRDNAVLDGQSLDRAVILDGVRRLDAEVQQVSADDAGDYSFVRQVVPILFGRKVKGYDELQVLVDLIRATDRNKFLNIVLHSSSPYWTEYVEHWSEVLVDRFRVHRESEKVMTSCFAVTTPPRPPATGVAAANLARCVHTTDATANCTAGTAFNMNDLLRSALALDNLAPAYRGYLFAMVAHPIGGAEVTEQNQRDDLAATFGHVYIHRNQDCLACHNTTASVSGEFDINGNPSYWNRHFPVPGNLEVAVFGTPTGRDTREVNAIFRPDVTGGTVRPWGMSNCGAFRAAQAVSDDPLTINNAPIRAYFVRNHGTRGTVWELDAVFREGHSLLERFGLRRNELVAPPNPTCVDHCPSFPSPPALPAPPAAMTTLIQTRCANCHRAGHVSGLNLDVADWQTVLVSEPARRATCSGFDFLVVPNNAARSCVQSLVQTNAMPPGGLSASEKMTVTSWITGLPAGAGCDVGEPSVCTATSNDNPAAFTFLIAMNIVNQTWEEVMGYPLTIPNYFPRNAAQRDIVGNLTESVFIPNGWSLKQLLVRILTSEYFNRRAPATTPLGSAYMVTRYAKPFEVNDPRFPPEAQAGWTPGGGAPSLDFVHLFTHARSEESRSRHSNTMTDGLYRYSARTLLNSLHVALGWPRVPRFGSGTSYPSDELRKAIGQFYHDAEPGFRAVDFQGLLAWEETHGLCVNRSSQPDWVDRVVTRVAAAPGAFTRRTLAIAMRDWLLGHGRLATDVPAGEANSEETLLTTMLGNLDAPLTASTAAARQALTDSLRRYCGVLIETPHFLLAGLAPEDVGPRPALRVCNTTPCTFKEVCTTLVPAVRGGVSSAALACGDDCLVVSQATPRGPIGPDDAMCPRWLCERIPGGTLIPKDCLLTPEKCIPDIPECKFPCATIDCCGGPLPPFDRPRYYLGLAEGGVVELAEGVRIVRYRMGRSTTLEKGARLGVGDWLHLPTGSRVRIVTKAGVFQTPPGGVPKTEDGGGWRFLVTGESVAKMRETSDRGVPLPKEWISRSFKEEWRRGGAAGADTIPGQKRIGPSRPLAR